MIDYFASFKNPIIEENNDRNAHNEHFNKNMYIVLFNKICKRLSLSRYKAWGGNTLHLSMVLSGSFLF